MKRLIVTPFIGSLATMSFVFASQGTEIQLTDWEHSHDRTTWTRVRVLHDWPIGEPFDEKADAQEVIVRRGS